MVEKAHRVCAFGKRGLSPSRARTHARTSAMGLVPPGPDPGRGTEALREVRVEIVCARVCVGKGQADTGGPPGGDKAAPVHVHGWIACRCRTRLLLSFLASFFRLRRRFLLPPKAGRICCLLLRPIKGDLTLAGLGFNRLSLVYAAGAAGMAMDVKGMAMDVLFRRARTY